MKNRQEIVFQINNIEKLCELRKITNSPELDELNEEILLKIRNLLFDVLMSLENKEEVHKDEIYEAWSKTGLENDWNSAYKGFFKAKQILNL